MQIHICQSCGLGVVGQRRCDACMPNAYSRGSVQTCAISFLFTISIASVGMQSLPDCSIVGQKDFVAAGFSKHPASQTLKSEHFGSQMADRIFP